MTTQTNPTQKIKNPIDGILLLNKPEGITSNKILQKVKHLFNAKKAGHTGSLDPIATGMLPICFGEATKFSQYLLDSDKCYLATVKLGIKTTTSDLSGDIIEEREVKGITKENIEKILQNFKGTIEQIPSMYSALKHKGQPLYKYARNGEEIQRAPRTVKIHSLELLDFADNHFAIKVICSKGTYIRNLAEDIGESLNVGAHIIKLHREYVAGFKTETMYTFDELLNTQERASLLLSADRAVYNFPILKLTPTQLKDLQHGKIITNIDQNKGIIRLYNEEKFVGLGEVLENEMLKVLRLFSF